MELLDLKDRKILYELDLNSRQSNSKIAKKVGLSKDSVGYRIKRLEKKNIIRGYNSVINSSRLGYMAYRVYFNLIDTPPKKNRELINFLQKKKNVWWIAKLDGAWNFLFAIWVRSNKEFNEFFKDLNIKFRKNIKEKLICPIVSYKIFDKTFLIDKEQVKKATEIGEGKKQNFDRIDLEILGILSKNARTPLIEIAHKLKLDNMTIHHRIKKLDKNKIIRGHKADLNFNIIKRDFYSVKINLNDVSKTKEIEGYIYTIPELTATTEAVGGYDLEFDLEVKDSEQYFRIIESLENKFDFIREIIYFRVLKNYKILYMPEI